MCVQPDWLKDLVPLFADPRVGLVQSPQDHRDGDRSVMHDAMNAEYAGFFDIGMVQRNEFNAIIVHGTMCLIRRAAIEVDRRLVERHHRRGCRSRADAARTRLARPLHQPPLRLWAAARHLRCLSSASGIAGRSAACKSCASIGGRCCRGRRASRRSRSASTVSAGSIGSAPKASASSLRCFNIAWVPLVVFGVYPLKDRMADCPSYSGITISARCRIASDRADLAVFTVAHFVALYRLRVRATPAQMLGAVIAAMSVQWTVARAVGIGVVKERPALPAHLEGRQQPQGFGFPGFLGSGGRRHFCLSAPLHCL